MTCTCFDLGGVSTMPQAYYVALGLMTPCAEHDQPRPYYQAGGVTIYLGDCRDVMPRLQPVDHVLTDPPYARDVYKRLGFPKTNAGSKSPSRAGIGNYQYSSASIEKLGVGAIGFIDEMLDAVALDIARLTRRWAVVFSDVESCHRWRLQLEAAKMRYIRTGAWVKPDPMPQFSGDRPGQGFEACTIAHAQGPMRWNGGGFPALWTYGTSKGKERPDHPSPKPVALMRRLVEQFTDPGEVILDPFAGSGTTLVAAKALGRRAIGIEIEEKWAEGAAKRCEAQTLPIAGFDHQPQETAHNLL